MKSAMLRVSTLKSTVLFSDETCYALCPTLKSTVLFGDEIRYASSPTLKSNVLFSDEIRYALHLFPEIQCAFQ